MLPGSGLLSGATPYASLCVLVRGSAWALQGARFCRQASARAREAAAAPKGVRAALVYVLRHALRHGEYAAAASRLASAGQVSGGSATGGGGGQAGPDGEAAALLTALEKAVAEHEEALRSRRPLGSHIPRRVRRRPGALGGLLAACELL